MQCTKTYICMSEMSNEMLKFKPRKCVWWGPQNKPENKTTKIQLDGMKFPSQYKYTESALL